MRFGSQPMEHDTSRGASTTCRVAVELVVAPNSFKATTLTWSPSRAAEPGAVVYLLVIAPGTGTPFVNHCSERGGAPSTATTNVAVSPSMIVASAGCRVKTGAARVKQLMRTSSIH